MSSQVARQNFTRVYNKMSIAELQVLSGVSTGIVSDVSLAAYAQVGLLVNNLQPAVVSFFFL
jgi:hypothetical protein